MQGTTCLSITSDLDVAQPVLTRAQQKKLKRKEENQKITIVEEEVKNQMEIDTSAGTELGAPL